MKKYVIRITSNGHSDFVTEGSTYCVNDSIYVPLCSSIADAKKYKSKTIAERASRRSGENMYGTIEIMEIDEE